MNVADPGKRFVAFLIDVVPIIVLNVISRIFNNGFLAGLIALGILGYTIYNQFYLQGTTGQTIGKKNQGIKLVKMDDGSPVGPLMAFVRSLLSGIISLACLVDHWIILVDKDKQRISDKILKFHVYDA